MNAYREKLANPRWQRRRTEIMQRANFACEVCGDDNQELHVHHVEYRREYRNPWEYPDNLLRCLCSDCHTLAHLPRHKVCAYVEPDKAQRVRPVVAFEDQAQRILHELEAAASKANSGFEVIPMLRDRTALQAVVRERAELLRKWIEARSEETEHAMNEAITANR